MYGAKGAKSPMSKKMDSKTSKLRKAAKERFGKKRPTAKSYGS